MTVPVLLPFQNGNNNYMKLRPSLVKKIMAVILGISIAALITMNVIEGGLTIAALK